MQFMKQTMSTENLLVNMWIKSGGMDFKHLLFSLDIDN